MAHYRIYLLDGCNRIASGKDAMCDDDGEACALARTLVEHEREAEVWEGTRYVARVKINDTNP